MKVLSKFLIFILAQTIIFGNGQIAESSSAKSRELALGKTTLSPCLTLTDKEFKVLFNTQTGADSGLVPVLSRRYDRLTQDEIDYAKNLLIRDIYLARRIHPVYLAGDNIETLEDVVTYLSKYNHYTWQSLPQQRREKFLKVIEILQKYVPSFIRRRYPDTAISSINIGGSLVEFWSSYPLEKNMPYGEDLDVYVVCDTLNPGERDLSLRIFFEGQAITEELADNGIYGVENIDICMANETRMEKEGNADFSTMYGSGVTIFGRSLSVTKGITDPFTVLARIETLLGANAWQKEGRLVVADWLLRGLAQKLGVPFDVYAKDINGNKEEALEISKNIWGRVLVFLAKKRHEGVFLKDILLQTLVDDGLKTSQNKEFILSGKEAFVEQSI